MSESFATGGSETPVTAGGGGESWVGDESDIFGALRLIERTRS